MDQTFSFYLWDVETTYFKGFLHIPYLEDEPCVHRYLWGFLRDQVNSIVLTKAHSLYHRLMKSIYLPKHGDVTNRETRISPHHQRCR
jgi:hypothetical protein